MRVLGIDPGSRSTGYGVIEAKGGRERIVAFGTIRPPANATFPARLRAVHRGMCGVIEEHHPEAVAIEDAFLGRNVKTVALISQVRGVLLLAAEAAGLSISEYAPRQVKLATVGHGSASKDQVGRMVCRILALSTAPGSADESDALAVAICHAHNGGADASPARAQVLAALASRRTPR